MAPRSVSCAIFGFFWVWLGMSPRDRSIRADRLYRWIQIHPDARLIKKGMSFEDLEAERKAQLARIEQIRGRDVLVYAANLSVRTQAPVSIE